MPVTSLTRVGKLQDFLCEVNQLQGYYYCHLYANEIDASPVCLRD